MDIAAALTPSTSPDHIQLAEGFFPARVSTASVRQGMPAGQRGPSEELPAGPVPAGDTRSSTVRGCLALTSHDTVPLGPAREPGGAAEPRAELRAWPGRRQAPVRGGQGSASALLGAAGAPPAPAPSPSPLPVHPQRIHRLPSPSFLVKSYHATIHVAG